MKKLILTILLISPIVYAEGPRFTHKDSITDREFDNAYQDIRSVSHRVSNLAIVNVKDFGAAGDGSTDDSTAVQAAIDYAAISNKAVFFPSGIYRVVTLNDSLIAVPLMIFGESAYSSIITSTGNINRWQLGSNSIIRDLGFSSTSNVIDVTVAGSTDVTLSDIRAYSGGYAVQISSDNVHNFTLKDSEINATGFGVLVNDSDGGSNFRVINSSISSVDADAIEINNPNSTFKNVIISGNFLSNTALSGPSTAGFGIGIAAGENMSIFGNIIPKSRLEAIHLEDGHRNISIVGNYLESSQMGIKISNDFDATPSVILGNVIVATTTTGTTNVAGINLFADASLTVSGTSIIGNRIDKFVSGIRLGTNGTNRATLTFADGNTISRSSHTLVATGGAGSGDQRQFGTNLSSGTVSLFRATAGHYSFGKVYSESAPEKIITSPSYGGTMPSSVDGFGYPMANMTTAGSGAPEVVWNLFEANTNNRFFGRIRVRTQSSVTSNWVYTSADLLWDGTTLTISNQISRIGGAIISAPTFSVGSNQLRFVMTNSSALSLTSNYVEFDGEYWDY